MFSPCLLASAAAGSASQGKGEAEELGTLALGAKQCAEDWVVPADVSFGFVFPQFLHSERHLAPIDQMAF